MLPLSPVTRVKIFGLGLVTQGLGLGLELVALLTSLSVTGIDAKTFLYIVFYDKRVFLTYFIVPTFSKRWQ